MHPPPQVCSSSRLGFGLNFIPAGRAHTAEALQHSVQQYQHPFLHLTYSSKKEKTDSFISGGKKKKGEEWH